MRLVFRAIAALPFVAALAFFALVVTTPGSLSGFGYALAVVLFTAAGVFREPAPRRRLVQAALVLLPLTACARVVVAGHGRTIKMQTPSTESARWLDRVIDEEDLSVDAARALRWTGFLHDPDVPALADVMRRDYARMHDAEGDTPSPVLATYAGLEEPGRDDVLVIGDVERSAGVVVFLHGFAGSFTLPCWVVSRAAADAGFATVCPSTRWVGDWWSREGEATLRDTLTGLRARGAKHIVLAGLSNGAIGASLLAPRLVGSIDGLVLISGASPEATSPFVPVLAVQGAKDAQISASVVRAYAERVGGRYLSLDAGHFAMLVREDEAMGAVTSFLRRGIAGAGRETARHETSP